MVIKLFEFARYLFAGIGFYLAYLPNSSIYSSTNLLIIWVVIPIAGMTAIESLFFSKETALAKGREAGSAYQIQSGFNNLSVAIAGGVVYLLHWGAYANLAVLMVLLIFLFLSALNHTYEYFISKNLRKIHIIRLLLTLILIGASIPFYLDAPR